MNKQTFKGIIIGIIIMLILPLSVSVFAQTSNSELMKVYYTISGIKIDGNDMKLDERPFIYEGRTYVPLRAISENLDCDVKWNGTLKTIDINTQKPNLGNETILSNGNYIAGKHFKAGIYDIIAIKGGGYVSSSNIFNGGISAIMGIADDEFYQKEYKNISLPNETTLSIHDVTIKLIFKE